MEPSEIRDSLPWRTRIPLRSMRATAGMGNRQPWSLTLCLGHAVEMARTAIGHPGGPKIRQLDLQAFDLEPQRRAARERERHRPSRGARLGKLDRQKVKDLVLSGRVHVLALAGEHPLEAQRRAAAAQLRARS